MFIFFLFFSIFFVNCEYLTRKEYSTSDCSGEPIDTTTIWTYDLDYDCIDGFYCSEDDEGKIFAIEATDCENDDECECDQVDIVLGECFFDTELVKHVVYTGCDHVLARVISRVIITAVGFVCYCLCTTLPVCIVIGFIVILCIFGKRKNKGKMDLLLSGGEQQQQQQRNNIGSLQQQNNSEWQLNATTTAAPITEDDDDDEQRQDEVLLLRGNPPN